MVHKDHKVSKVHKDPWDKLVLEDQKVKKVKEVYKVFKVYVVLKETPVKKVVLDQEVCVDR